jgi:transposase
VIGADETTWRLLGSGSKSWWAWSVCSPDAVVYQISPTRSAKDAGRILRDFSGVVVADGYSAYRTLRDQRAASRDGPAFELAACWAHVRRKFLEAEPNHPEATPIIKLIGRLYGVEAAGREAPDHLAVLRGEKSRELVGQLRNALLAIRALPRSSLARPSPTPSNSGPRSLASSTIRVSRSTTTRPSGLFAVS